MNKKLMIIVFISLVITSILMVFNNNSIASAQQAEVFMTESKMHVLPGNDYYTATVTCPAGSTFWGIAGRALSPDAWQGYIYMNNTPTRIDYPQGGWVNWPSVNTVFEYCYNSGCQPTLQSWASSNGYSYVHMNDAGSVDLISDSSGQPRTSNTDVNLYGLCYGVQPTATPTQTSTPAPASWSSNVLGDGDMEQQPISSYWFKDPNGLTIPGIYDVNFGRMSSNNIYTFLHYGNARCKQGYHLVGVDYHFIPWSNNPEIHWYDISQKFDWPGGDLYFRYSVGGSNTSDFYSTWSRNVPYAINITQVYTGQVYTIARLGVPNDWHWYDRNGMYPDLPAGKYEVHLSNDAELMLDGDLIKYDDIYFSQAPITESCIDVPIPATTVTATINATYTTYTPTSAGAAYNLILNCGFEQGNWYWDFKTGAQVIYGFANNWGYMESTTQNPGISQLFYWPGGQMYATFDSASNYNAYLQNVTTGVQYLIASGLKVSSTWVTYRTSLYVPSGSYRISLHYPAGNGPASYDNITVSLYGYASCSGGTQATMTLRPSSTSQNTATMFPTSTARPTNTMAPSSTVLANTATSTTQPTYTPYPTYTPQPTYTPYQSPVPTQTPRPQPTFTSYPTYTPQPTYTQIPTYTQQPTYTQEATSTTDPGTETSTPRPTYTPWPTYTPGIPGLVGGLPTNPPPPQPPPSYFTDCQRPQNGYDMAAWLEYNRCVALSYFDWSPNAQATLEALPGLFGNKEPLGSISEAEQTMNQLAGLVKSYDTGSAGLPGTHDQPDLGSFFDNSQPGPWTTGTWNFSQTGSTPNMACNVRVTGVLGELAKGFCWFFQILAEKGVMAWVQLFINIACIGFLLLYIWQKFIDAGSGAA